MGKQQICVHNAPINSGVSCPKQQLTLACRVIGFDLSFAEAAPAQDSVVSSFRLNVAAPGNVVATELPFNDGQTVTPAECTPIKDALAQAPQRRTNTINPHQRLRAPDGTNGVAHIK